MIATKVTLFILLWLPGQDPIPLEQPVDNLSVCFAMTKELINAAQTSPMISSRGGRFDAACSVAVPPTEEH